MSLPQNVITVTTVLPHSINRFHGITVKFTHPAAITVVTAVLPLSPLPCHTLTLNAPVCNVSTGWLKMPDMKMTDQIAGREIARHEIAGHENTGHEFARHDKYRMKIDYITLQCAFLLKFKSFVCKANVLTYKKLNCVWSSKLNIAVFSNLYTLYCGKLFAAATHFNRFVVNVAY